MVDNEFEVVNRHKIEIELTMRKMFTKFMDLLDSFLILQALAILLLQTIGSK